MLGKEAGSPLGTLHRPGRGHSSGFASREEPRGGRAPVKVWRRGRRVAAPGASRCCCCCRRGGQGVPRGRGRPAPPPLRHRRGGPGGSPRHRGEHGPARRPRQSRAGAAPRRPALCRAATAYSTSILQGWSLPESKAGTLGECGGPGDAALPLLSLTQPLLESVGAAGTLRNIPTAMEAGEAVKDA